MGKGSKGWRKEEASFVAGAVAGMFSKTITAPLSRLTIMRQAAAVEATGVAHGSMLRELADMARRGPHLLFRGNLAAVLHRVPFSGTYHGTYQALRNCVTKSAASEPPFTTKLAIGSAAGAAACTAAYPLDLAKTLIAAGKSPSLKDTLQKEIRKGGPFALYRGLRPTLATVTPNLAVNYAVYDSCTALLRQRFGAGPNTSTSMAVAINLTSAATAGIASSLATHPLDVIRKVVQLDHEYRFQGSWARAAATVASNGPTRFWSGLAPELTKVVPAVCLSFGIFEIVKSSLLHI